MAGPEIKVLADRIITTNPAPGEAVNTVAVTYRIEPRPPEVIFIPAADLPDVAYRLEHPTEGQAPAKLRKEGDAVRRQRIEARLGEQATTPERAI